MERFKERDTVWAVDEHGEIVEGLWTSVTSPKGGYLVWSDGYGDDDLLDVPCYRVFKTKVEALKKALEFFQDKKKAQLSDLAATEDKIKSLQERLTTTQWQEFNKKYPVLLGRRVRIEAKPFVSPAEGTILYDLYGADYPQKRRLAVNVASYGPEWIDPSQILEVLDDPV